LEKYFETQLMMVSWPVFTASLVFGTWLSFLSVKLPVMSVALMATAGGAGLGGYILRLAFDSADTLHIVFIGAIMAGCVGLTSATLAPHATWCILSTTGVIFVGWHMALASFGSSGKTYLPLLAASLLGGLITAFTSIQYFKHSLAVISSAIGSVLIAYAAYLWMPQPTPFFLPVILLALIIALSFLGLATQLWILRPSSVFDGQPSKATDPKDPVAKSLLADTPPPRYPTIPMNL
jgi:hypothetical protein